MGALASYPKPASASDLFVGSPGTDKLLPFSIAGDGAVTPIACTGSSCNTGLAPWGVAVSPSGKFVYVSNVDGGLSNSSVSGFAVGSDGTLTPLPCSPSTNCETQKEPTGIAISPSGSFLYAANQSSNTVSIFAIAGDGTLTQVPCSPVSNCNTGSGPKSIAVTPDGRFLYVVNGGTLSSYAIAANGTLTPLPCSALCSSGAALGQAAVTPSGAFLYVLREGDSQVVPLAIASDGSLNPVPCSPASNCEGGSGEGSLAISPNGQDLYVTNSGSPSTVVVFSIGPGGALTKQTCSPASDCDAGKEPVGLTLSPSDGSLYAVDYGTSKLLPFSVEANGLLAPLACTPSSNCEAGSQLDYTQSIAAQPDQGPVAALSATPAPAGSPTLLDARGSSTAPGGEVVRWDWNFGDGTVLENGGPTPQRTYANPGVYTVTVTVSDQDGCSTRLIFTGQTAYCNGSAAAQATRTITVPPPIPLAPSVSNLSETARTWRESNKLAQISARKKKKPPVGSTFSFTLNEPASVTFTFTAPASGRKIGKRCVAQTKKNKKKHRCTRTAVAGELTFSAHAGTNKVHFGGRISKHRKLRPGSYTLLVSATASGMHSTPRTLHFKIAKG